MSATGGSYIYFRPVQHTQIHRLKEELIIEILNRCGPTCLFTLRFVCYSFCKTIATKISCWDSTFARLGLPPCPSELSVLGKVPQLCYTNILFAGGLCECCEKMTIGTPVSVSLRIWTCSDECKKRVFANKALFTKLDELSDSEIELSLRTALKDIVPHHPHPEHGVLFRTSQLEAARDRFYRVLNTHQIDPAEQEDMASLLRDWEAQKQETAEYQLINADFMARADAYLANRRQITQDNFQILHRFCREDKINFRDVCATLAVRRVVESFNMDLTKLDLRTWYTIRNLVFSIPCPTCQRLFLNTQDMHAHVATYHRRENAD
ncbi:hypothetical protein Hypma_001316 [Hypsizygus marmoreus]|uniref:C2H2-type domain-containing protein n=1 Tax=Hypsizygus marmoreus TaxID=39966 RepID=A0A369KBD5_HYPMA|nr:hypothetical protein Hypma_001316 [Hypsizygus marmoreus]